MPQPPQMIPVMPSYPPTNITTEQIQKYLDENKKLILAILDNQNLGKLAECAHLCYSVTDNAVGFPLPGFCLSPLVHVANVLSGFSTKTVPGRRTIAAIADAQPQSTPTMSPQMAPHPAMQPGGYFMQHPQAAAMSQQPGMYPQKVPLQFNSPHQMQDPQHLLYQQHQQAMQGQMGIRPGGPNNSMHPMHSEASLGGGSSGGPPQPSGPSDGRAGNKQEGSEAGGNGQGSTTGGHGGGDGADEAK
ncbi:Protein SSXT [Gossypium arboreum]|uniref:Protein SSXT n=1 Tax=Gossypium arboreum TaxID=29729 RepID=A0A0B0MWR9_GOSAR|nr:Protein SSXT [Gossypium arboreum]